MLERVSRAAERSRVADRASRRARSRLHAEIVAASRQGASVRMIARAAGLSSTRVHQIIADAP